MSIPVWVYITAYAIGFLVTPYVISLVEGWPFVAPRIDGFDGCVMFFAALLWPLVLAVWGLYVWWVFFCSAAGAKTHEAIKREFERRARDG